jgi:hypothetical protein
MDGYTFFLFFLLSPKEPNSDGAECLHGLISHVVTMFKLFVCWDASAA